MKFDEKWSSELGEQANSEPSSLVDFLLSSVEDCLGVASDASIRAIANKAAGLLRDKKVSRQIECVRFRYCILMQAQGCSSFSDDALVAEMLTSYFMRNGNESEKKIVSRFVLNGEGALSEEDARYKIVSNFLAECRSLVLPDDTRFSVLMTEITTIREEIGEVLDLHAGGSGLQREGSGSAEGTRLSKVVVWSPVNVKVFLEGSSTPLMSVDLNDGLDHAWVYAALDDECELRFSARGFDRRVRFTVPSDGRLDVRLDSLLSKSEMQACYDRDEALAQLAELPTSYAFKQLGFVGVARDLPTLERILEQYAIRYSKPWFDDSGKTSEDGRVSRLAARCAECIGRIGNRLGLESWHKAVENAYFLYPNGSRRVYGYMFPSSPGVRYARLLDEAFRLSADFASAVQRSEVDKLNKAIDDLTSVMRKLRVLDNQFLRSAASVLGAYDDFLAAYAVFVLAPNPGEREKAAPDAERKYSVFCSEMEELRQSLSRQALVDMKTRSSLEGQK